jgi:predicted dehydrogenase
LKSNRKVKVGFNHRYHPAIKKAKEIFESGDIGKPMFIRGRYGHGGRIGYDDEWRSKKEISGGGELIDQGVHLIDLSRWFLGEFEYVRGFTNTYYWNMDVEDNAFLELRTKENLTAWLHASCSEWKNMFSFEIYGRNGKLHIEGLGGSYGTEKLSYYKMLPEMGPPETYIWEYPGDDKSWKSEYDDFLNCISKGEKINGNLYDAYKSLEIVDKVYFMNKK